MEVDQSPLGKKSIYSTQYDPQLLFPIARQKNRDEIGVSSPLPFHGEDIWNAYELSWLNSQGKPMIAIAEFRIPCQSSHIVESKSFKLYLNSFNQTLFEDVATIKNVLQRDLSQACGDAVKVDLIMPAFFGEQRIIANTGECLDEQDVLIAHYHVHPEYLTLNDNEVTERVYSRLLKSNCLVTSQPDFATLTIHYSGKQIDHAGLLKYIISFREHNEFHEPCVERIFMDIMRYCQPKQLTVYARYTRRGGLDINPFRSNWESECHNMRLARQ